MVFQAITNGVSQGACTLAVDNAYPGETSHVGIVQVLLGLIQTIFDPGPAQIQFDAGTLNIHALIGIALVGLLFADGLLAQFQPLDRQLEAEIAQLHIGFAGAGMHGKHLAAGLQIGDPDPVADLDGAVNPLVDIARHDDVSIDGLSGLVPAIQFLFGAGKKFAMGVASASAGVAERASACRLATHLLDLFTQIFQLGPHDLARFGDHGPARFFNLGRLVAQILLNQLRLSFTLLGAIFSPLGLLLGRLDIVEQRVGFQRIGP